MVTLTLAVLLAEPFSRDTYGVPTLTAGTEPQAMRLLGIAHATDRWNQMNSARIIARGRAAEFFGPQSVNNDLETLRTGYTDSELLDMVRRLPAAERAAMQAYVEGVNATKPNGTEPWTLEDSAAIAVLMARRFGNGGGGELRNLALVGYLRTQPVKDRLVDALNDIAFFNDPTSTPTISTEDDLSQGRAARFFPAPTRDITERHLARLPDVNILELLPALRAIDQTESRLLAESHGVPSKLGSYAILVSKARGGGSSFLLSAPQMGNSTPSPVYEAGIRLPGIQFQGISIPGLPGFVIGHNEHISWGLTSGVADVSDIYFASAPSPGQYTDGRRLRPLTTITRTLKVKGEADRTVRIERTHLGPVVFRTRDGKILFTQRYSYWGRELEMINALRNVFHARTTADALKAGESVPVSFNLFVLDRSGTLGYRFCGAMPIRAAGYDPRLPLPVEPQTEWRGFVSPRDMPHALAPRAGLIANWNNKPASWWPNMDTPVWGSTFRNESLLSALGRGRMDTNRLMQVSSQIARADDATNGRFVPLIQNALESASGPDVDRVRARLAAYEGTLTPSDNLDFMGTFVTQLRNRLYLPLVGNMMGTGFMDQVIQPSVLLNALNGRSPLVSLTPDQRDELIRASAFAAASTERAPTFGSIRYPNQEPIPFANRGTYIQVIEYRDALYRAGSVLGPGNAESGPHSADQVPLVRNWGLKRAQP